MLRSRYRRLRLAADEAVKADAWWEEQKLGSYGYFLAAEARRKAMTRLREELLTERFSSAKLVKQANRRSQ